MQATLLDGHKLVLQLSMHRPEHQQSNQKPARSSKAAPEQDPSTKLVVRNVAFEATRKDISALFAPFGHLKSCRLPRKYDGTHRCARKI